MLTPPHLFARVLTVQTYGEVLADIKIRRGNTVTLTDHMSETGSAVVRKLIRIARSKA